MESFLAALKNLEIKNRMIVSLKMVRNHNNENFKLLIFLETDRTFLENCSVAHEQVSNF
jgi:hypothetical protein